MIIKLPLFLLPFFLSSLAFAATNPTVPAHLPGELSADEVLDGKYPYPPSPTSLVGERAEGFDASKLGKVPAPGIHPRILISPDQLPDLRIRLKGTETGRALYENLQGRLKEALHNPANWGGEFYTKLAAGDLEGARSLAKEHKGLPPGVGHYQPFLEAIVWEAFDAMITEDQIRGKQAATAITTYAELIKPLVKKALQSPLNDDVWRAKVQGPITGDWGSDQGVRDAMGYHNIGYAYDFAYNFMDEKQRDTVRSLIAEATSGRLWMGARLPHHFRNWNWCAVGLGQPLLALAIEGEKGYDPRVYKMGTDIARDYITYGISPKGVSTEAVGYTQFGLVWANPFMVAAARRGEKFLTQDHHRSMPDWYLAAMEPNGTDWTSHGDGAVTGPAIPTLLMWKSFYPNDPQIDFLLQKSLHADGKEMLKDKLHMIEPLLWAIDPAKGADGKWVDYQNGKMLNAPLTFFDPTRSTLFSRSAWDTNATFISFECRTDSVGSSHEHSDRGGFTLSSMGRRWGKENFRSPETRHHNGVLIDGKGQGFWPGPGKWLGLADSPDFLIAACETKDAYDWWWPKQASVGDPKMKIRYQFSRWESYKLDNEKFVNNYGLGPFARDTRPSVVAHWKGFDKGDPRMWDEDSWPVRLPFNPVKKAFRTLAFARGDHPYTLIVDDIQKDGVKAPAEHLYEWVMQTGPDTDVVSVKDNDIILSDATVKRDAEGNPKPEKGDRLLLVRVLHLNNPAKLADYTTKPSLRLETFERKDTFEQGGRSFGLDKRLVVGSRAVAPDFKILLYPVRQGEPLPETIWNEAGDTVTLKSGGATDQIGFKPTDDGRTVVSLSRNGAKALMLQP